MNKNFVKNIYKKNTPRKSEHILKRIFYIPDSSNIIERQRTFVFLYASLGFLIGIGLNILTAFGPQSGFIMALNSAHAVLILTLLILYQRRLISIYRSVLLLTLSIQIEISIEMLYMSRSEGIIMETYGILSNTILLGMLLILAITAYIRYLPYILTVITITTLGVCWHITKDSHIGHVIPVLTLAFTILSYMGSRLMQGVTSLQNSKDDLARDQNHVFQFLNMNKDELFELIRFTHRKKLSDKQKGELLELLNEQTKASVLKIAVDVIEKKKQNLAVLDDRRLRLTPYEKEICLMIIQGMTISDIATKLRKNINAIATTRAKIRAKLSLKKEENLRESLLKMVGGGSGPQAEQEGIKSLRP